MPQAKRSQSGGRSGARKSSGASSRSGSRSSASRPRSTSSRSSASGSRSTAKRSTSSRSRASTGTRAKSSGTTRARASATTQDARIRELNERILDAGKKTGTATLDLYEGALKGIADMLERGAGASEVEWISRVMTSQADFIRDVAKNWTGAARQSLK
jgi:hypothetical protein